MAGVLVSGTMEALRNIAGGQNANSKLFKQLLGKDVSEEDMKILEKQAEG